MIAHLNQVNPMTVSDLIECLTKFPPDMRVILKGYEGGLTDIHNLEQKEILLNVNSEWYYGAHDTVDSVSDPDSYKKETAVLISK